jgi:hypothetical protein
MALADVMAILVPILLGLGALLGMIASISRIDHTFPVCVIAFLLWYPEITGSKNVIIILTF